MRVGWHLVACSTASRGTPLPHCPHHSAHPRVTQHRARDGDALLLAAAELHATLAQLGVVTLGQALNEGERVGDAGSLHHLQQTTESGPGSAAWQAGIHMLCSMAQCVPKQAMYA